MVTNLTTHIKNGLLREFGIKWTRGGSGPFCNLTSRPRPSESSKISKQNALAAPRSGLVGWGWIELLGLHGPELYTYLSKCS